MCKDVAVWVSADTDAGLSLRKAHARHKPYNMDVLSPLDVIVYEGPRGCRVARTAKVKMTNLT